MPSVVWGYLVVLDPRGRRLQDMATRPRLQAEGAFYHLYNRGIRKLNIFLEVRDYERFLQKLVEYKEKKDTSLLCYCLMPNHFHLLAQQKSNIPITEFMHLLGTGYAKYFNTKYELVGSLFQGRFRSKIIDNEGYLLHLSRYIHLNSLELNPYSRKEMLTNYRWSSYSEFVKDSGTLCDGKEIILDYFSKTLPNLSYREFVESKIDGWKVEDEEKILEFDK